MEVTDGSFSRDDLNKLMSTAPIGKSETLNLNFFGKGSTYFGIVVLNVILTIVTFGLYYPWAKAAYRKYLWNETEFKDSRFVFNGTGKEMFKGFVIAYIIIIGFYASLSLIAFFSFGWVFTILFFFLMMMLFPFAIFGGWRYRVTRTSWRGIFFSFDGNLKEFMKIYFPALILTIITLGIYGAWMRVKLQKYLFRHTKIGNLRMDFHGNGGDLFVINLLGAILFYPSLGMYTPIWMKQLFNFTVEHTTLEDGEKRRALKSNLLDHDAIHENVFS